MLVRYQIKADVVRRAWLERFKELPSRNAVFMCMAVAEHETRMGDAWPGEYNWGALQIPANQWTPEQRAKRATAKKGERVDNGVAHGDSSPGPSGQVHYVTWFYACPDDVAGAKLFLKILVQDRPSVAAVIHDDDPHAVAAAMYATGYYEGVHNPKAAGGKEKNIADYTSAVSRCLAAIKAACVGWGGDLSEGIAPPYPSEEEAANTLSGLARDANIQAVETMKEKWRQEADTERQKRFTDRDEPPDEAA